VIVVTDTSVVLNLCFLRAEGLLPTFYAEVVAPPAVKREFERLATFDKRFQRLKFPSFIAVEEASTTPSELANAIDLDEGEIAALALAVERKIQDVLIDESTARAKAVKLGLRVTGVIGVLIRARQDGLIPALKPLLLRLRDEAEFWLSEELIQHALHQVGEA
jgi:uncharacterized protein